MLISAEIIADTNFYLFEIVRKRGNLMTKSKKALIAIIVLFAVWTDKLQINNKIYTIDNLAYNGLMFSLENLADKNEG